MKKRRTFSRGETWRSNSAGKGSAELEHYEMETIGEGQFGHFVECVRHRVCILSNCFAGLTIILQLINSIKNKEKREKACR